MKSGRHAKILELVKKYNIETQEELSELLLEAGYPVTQATVSRDIRQLQLTKVPIGGKQKYVALSDNGQEISKKYTRVFQEGFLSMDMAQNILVIKTISGMAMAVAAALDNMDCTEIVGSIAGDDTIMCAVRSVEDTERLMERLRKVMEGKEQEDVSGR